MYYDTSHEIFNRFKILEHNYAALAREIPPFEQKKVAFKREAGVWLNESDEQKEMINRLSSNREWIAGWDPENKWYNFPLILKDTPIGFAKEICPTTIEILQSIGGINIAGFALLLPHSRLSPHTDPTGPTYGTMAFNMLLSGEHSSLIVGKSIHMHELGKAVLFNSELEHYARNDSNNIRTILYMDVQICHQALTKT